MDVHTLQNHITDEITQVELQMVHERSKGGDPEENTALMELEARHDNLNSAWNINNLMWAQKS